LRSLIAAVGEQLLQEREHAEQRREDPFFGAFSRSGCQ
jgi:hypothetical protein